TRRMPMSLVIDPDDSLGVMREEIFGPILPVKPYDSVEEAIGYVNSGERPLGLYVFAGDEGASQSILDRTSSGGAAGGACAAHGWKVYASARRPETLSELEAKGCRTVALDVSDEASMQAAVTRVTEAEGAIGVLINNAGYSQSGAVETVPMEQARKQFETNV